MRACEWPFVVLEVARERETEMKTPRVNGSLMVNKGEGKSRSSARSGRGETRAGHGRVTVAARRGYESCRDKGATRERG